MAPPQPNKPPHINLSEADKWFNVHKKGLRKSVSGADSERDGIRTMLKITASKLLAAILIGVVLNTATCAEHKSLIKTKLVGCWVCTTAGTEYSNRSFQLLFYKDYKFYYCIKKRSPNPYARGTFEISDSVITLTFGDTNEQHHMTVTSIALKQLCVKYNKNNLTFRRMQALKTLP